MTGDRMHQPYLPFGEPAADFGQQVGGRRDPSIEGSKKPVPTSLLAFADAWNCSDPDTAMRKACANLRLLTNQTRAPYALTPMLDAVSAVRADAKDAVGAHGRLHASKTGWTVYRRTDQPWRRIRFTEAHELGHILLYEKLASNRAWLDDLHSETAYTQVEKLCDLAAAELLIPSEDLRRELALRGLEQLGDYHRLYDLYMTSHRALLRRIAEVTSGTALTVWTWQEHRNGDDWRVKESYCQNAGGVYIPRGISRRRLDPDIIAIALEMGSANAEGHFDVRHRRYTGSMIALNPNHRNREQAELPMYHGRTIRDEKGSSVYVLHRDLASATIQPGSPPRRRRSVS